MIQILSLAFGYAIARFAYENIRWFIVREYYNRKNNKDGVIFIKTNSLFAYSSGIVASYMDGYELKFDEVMTFNKNKYRAILTKNI